MVGENGMTLSGGQRQRIAIARPGSYVLAFEGDGSLASDPCTLVDRVRVDGLSGLGGVAELSNEETVLEIENGAAMELDYSGIVTVGELIIDGVSYGAGLYGASTDPDVFSGTGVIRRKSGGTVFILK